MSKTGKILWQDLTVDNVGPAFMGKQKYIVIQDPANAYIALMEE